MIGGATTSELHTALKISPVYHAPILWMKDASQNVAAAGRLVGKDRDVLMEELTNRNRQLKESYEKQQQRQSEPLSLEEARKRKFRK
jgi:5-methyltetrahydrofolate--homocysteine methyltransferase